VHAEHDRAEALRGYGDSDDEESASRKGLGARSDGKGGKAALMAKALCTEGGLEAVRHQDTQSSRSLFVPPLPAHFEPGVGVGAHSSRRRNERS
jgi:hypothetical protein